MEAITKKQWQEEGEKLFGNNPLDWKFVCPSCGNVQTPRQFKALGADPELATLHCIGRHDGKHGNVDIGTKPGPCNYTSGGLFNLNKLRILLPEGKSTTVFQFSKE